MIYEGCNQLYSLESLPLGSAFLKTEVLNNIILASDIQHNDSKYVYIVKGSP